MFARIEFDEVWFADFEFSAGAGETPKPVCLVAHELRGGRVVKLFQEELLQTTTPPFAVSKNSLFVAYYASAEMGCYLALGWDMPANVLDLYAEFRNLTNGLVTPAGSGLLGALVYFGLDSMAAVEKEEMRALALRGGPYTNEERQALLDYCESDVIALRKLYDKMLSKIDTPRALLRGRYMKATARMEHTGVPIDTESLATLQTNWEGIQDELIRRIDANYGVFEGRTFKADRWAQWLRRNDIAWPYLESGNLALDDDTFRQMARANPLVAPIRELRSSLAELRLNDLAVGHDGRNRQLLSPFRARTGRNQPSNSRFIFGPSVWLRNLIQPAEGFGIAYIDWSQQEFGIAAALSKDPAMMEAYTSGDPYLSFAKQAGAVPPDATKKSHSAVRDQFEACALAVQYGMEAESLAGRIGQPVCQARNLLLLHHETYHKFWKWSDAVVDYAMTRLSLPTVFGWTIRIAAESNPRMLRNFPMQANGAEMLRLACCLATEQGVRVCAPVHDAVLIEAPISELEAAVQLTQACMVEATRIILGGFELRSDAKVFRHPERYADERGQKMWDTVWEILSQRSGSRANEN